MDPAMRELLTCKICSGTLTEPKILTTCGHTFCAQCLRREREKNGLSWTIACIDCGQETRVPENGVGGLPTNPAIEVLLKTKPGSPKQAAAQVSKPEPQNKKIPSRNRNRKISEPKITAPILDKSAEIREEVKESRKIIERNMANTEEELARLETFEKTREEDETKVLAQIQGYLGDLRNYIMEKEAHVMADYKAIVKKNRSSFTEKRKKLKNIAKTLGMGLQCLDNIEHNPTGPNNFYDYFRKNKSVIEYGNNEDYSSIDVFERITFIPEIKSLTSANLIGELRTQPIDFDSLTRRQGNSTPEKEDPYMIPMPPFDEEKHSPRYDRNLQKFSDLPQSTLLRPNRKQSTPVGPTGPIIPPRTGSRRSSIVPNQSRFSPPNGALPSPPSPPELPDAGTMEEYPGRKHHGFHMHEFREDCEDEDQEKASTFPKYDPPPPPPLRTTGTRSKSEKSKRVSNANQMAGVEVMVDYPPAPALIQKTGSRTSYIREHDESSPEIQRRTDSPPRPPKGPVMPNFTKALESSLLFRRPLNNVNSG